MSEPASFLIKNEGTEMESCETIPQQPSFTHPKKKKRAFEANQLAQIPLVCFVFKKKLRKVGIKLLNNAFLE